MLDTTVARCKFNNDVLLIMADADDCTDEEVFSAAKSALEERLRSGKITVADLGADIVIERRKAR